MKVPETPLKILVYQDEGSNIMAEYLELNGFKVITTDENNAIEQIENSIYDLCVISHYRSRTVGDLRLLKAIRRVNRNIPVIIVSDLSKYQFIVEAYKEGTDDYIIKPYNPNILIYKIKAIIERCGLRAKKIKSVYEIGGYTFDTVNNTITDNNGVKTKIQDKNSQVLALLCAYKNEILQTDEIMRRLWKGEHNFLNKRNLDVVMCCLRKYFNNDKRIEIITKRGLGYSLVVKSE